MIYTICERLVNELYSIIANNFNGKVASNGSPGNAF